MKIRSNRSLKKKEDNACSPELQYVNLSNSMHLKTGRIYIEKYSPRPKLINIKDNPNSERFNYYSCIPNISSKSQLNC